MRAALLTADGFAVRDVPRPRPGPGEILVRSLAQGVCGGDPYEYRTRAELGAKPQLLGHEGTGVVAELGPGVQSHDVGEIVTTMAGGFADYYLSPAAHALTVPEGLEPMLALGEPLACCVHASWRFGIRPGDRLALLGGGFMGLVCLWLAMRQGAGNSLVIEPDESRHEMALRFGASEVTNALSPANLAGLKDAFDVVIEAAGVQPALDVASQLVRQHGRLVLVGYHQSNGGQRQVDLKLWNYKAIDVINAHVRRNDEKLRAMAESIALLHTNELDIGPLASPYPLEEIETAFTDLLAHKPGLFKAVLVP